jgi:hypothetical protein
LGAPHEDIITIYHYWKPVQGKPLTRAIDTKARIRLINRPVCEADEMPAIFGKELIANKVKRSRHVATAIDVRVNALPVSD